MTSINSASAFTAKPAPIQAKPAAADATKFKPAADNEQSAQRTRKDRVEISPAAKAALAKAEAAKKPSAPNDDKG